MTVLSAQTILRRGLIQPCAERTTDHGLTYGLGPAGYDLRLDLGKEMFQVTAQFGEKGHTRLGRYLHPGQFLLAATREQFFMPADVLGVVHDKSTLARRGLSVFNTVIEPGWDGFLTLELVNNSDKTISLFQGQAIAQVVFHLLDEPTAQPYEGKYQHQEAGPQEARS